MDGADWDNKGDGDVDNDSKDDNDVDDDDGFVDSVIGNDVN